MFYIRHAKNVSLGVNELKKMQKFDLAASSQLFLGIPRAD
jgi:hypothetical protein